MGESDKDTIIPLCYQIPRSEGICLFTREIALVPALLRDDKKREGLKRGRVLETLIRGFLCFLPLDYTNGYDGQRQ